MPVALAESRPKQRLRAPGEPWPESLRAFAEEHGTISPLVAMRMACENLLHRTGPTRIPVALRPIARLMRAKIVNSKLDVEARLEVARDHYVIRINSEMTWRRQRFSLAHELAHLIVLESLRQRPEQLRGLMEPGTWRDLECVCNLGAAELLMPYDDFSVAAQRVGFDPRGLISLYDRYLASWSPLFVRYAEVFPPSGVAWWRRAVRPEDPPHVFRVVEILGHEARPVLKDGMSTLSLTHDVVSATAWKDTVVRDVGIWANGMEHQVRMVACRRPSFRAKVSRLPSYEGWRVCDEPPPHYEVVTLLIDPIHGLADGLPGLSAGRK